MRAWRDDAFGHSIGLYIRIHNGAAGTPPTAVTGIKVEAADPLHSTPCAMRLHEAEAQVLMNSLWECGIRPTKEVTSTGQLGATEKHLADMRAIAFAKVNVERPT